MKHRTLPPNQASMFTDAVQPSMLAEWPDGSQKYDATEAELARRSARPLPGQIRLDFVE